LELLHQRILFTLDGFIGLIDRKVKFCDDGTIHPWLSNIVPEHPSFVARKEPNNDSNGN
jgi:hypothetical protein